MEVPALTTAPMISLLCRVGFKSVSPEIVSAFKATGCGWWTHINNALRDWPKDHRPG
jgi:hypothetical protein